MELNNNLGHSTFGYASLTTQTIVELHFEIPFFFKDGLSSIKTNDKYGYIDASNEIVIEPIYDDTYNFSDGLASVKLNDKYGYINTDGTLIIPNIYDYINNFYNGLATVSLDKKIGIINTKGEIICKPKFSEIALFCENDVFPASYINDKGETKFVCINKHGDILFETNYTDIYIHFGMVHHKFLKMINLLFTTLVQTQPPN